MAGEQARLRAARGAGLVEYALALSLVVVASIGAIEALEDNTRDEVDDEAECIQDRPPTCQVPPAPPAPGPDGPGGPGDPGGGGSPSTFQALHLPPAVRATPDGPRFDVQATYAVTTADIPPVPLPDQTITAQVVVTSSSFPGRVGQTFYVDCLTDSFGSCTFAFDSRWDDVEALSIELVAIGIDTSYQFERAPDPDSVVTRP